MKYQYEIELNDDEYNSLMYLYESIEKQTEYNNKPIKTEYIVQNGVLVDVIHKLKYEYLIELYSDDKFSESYGGDDIRVLYAFITDFGFSFCRQHNATY